MNNFEKALDLSPARHIIDGEFSPTYYAIKHEGVFNTILTEIASVYGDSVQEAERILTKIDNDVYRFLNEAESDSGTSLEHKAKRWLEAVGLESPELVRITAPLANRDVIYWSVLATAYYDRHHDALFAAIDVEALAYSKFQIVNWVLRKYVYSDRQNESAIIIQNIKNELIRMARRRHLGSSPKFLFNTGMPLFNKESLYGDVEFALGSVNSLMGWDSTEQGSDYWQPIYNNMDRRKAEILTYVRNTDPEVLITEILSYMPNQASLPINTDHVYISPTDKIMTISEEKILEEIF